MDLRSEESVSLVTWESMRLGRWEVAIGLSKMSSPAPEPSSTTTATAITLISEEIAAVREAITEESLAGA